MSAHDTTLWRLVRVCAFTVAAMGGAAALPGPLVNDSTVLRAHGLPNFARVFVIIFENHEFNQIIGNTAAPYINSLARQYGLATAYTAVAHPSLPNYMALTGGATAFTTDCAGCLASTPNIADQIESSGRTWKAYMEAMPGDCWTADRGRYAQRHNPFIHYTDIVSNSARCRAHVVPLTNFYTDLASETVPSFSWISPDTCNDMHDCGVAAGDRWLSALLPKILSSAAFSNAVVYITWDEGTTTLGGGGRVPLIVVARDSAAGVQSSRAANHYSLLRTIEDAWGLEPLGKASEAAPLTEFTK
jgi:acid phosphatase